MLDFTMLRISPSQKQKLWWKIMMIKKFFVICSSGIELKGSEGRILELMYEPRNAQQVVWVLAESPPTHGNYWF